MDTVYLFIALPIMAAIVLGVPQLTAKYTAEYRITEGSLQYFLSAEKSGSEWRRKSG
jgi:hypothetical protein